MLVLNLPGKSGAGRTGWGRPSRRGCRCGALPSHAGGMAESPPVATAASPAPLPCPGRLLPASASGSVPGWDPNLALRSGLGPHLRASSPTPQPRSVPAGLGASGPTCPGRPRPRRPSAQSPAARPPQAARGTQPPARGREPGGRRPLPTAGRRVGRQRPRNRRVLAGTSGAPPAPRAFSARARPPRGHPAHRPGGSSPPVTLKGAPRGPRAQRSCPRQGQGRTPIARRLAGQQRSCPLRDAPRAPQNLSPHFLLVQTLQMSRRCSPGCLGSLLSMCVLDSRNVLAFSRTFTRSPSFPQLHQRSLSLRPWSKGNK